MEKEMIGKPNNYHPPKYTEACLQRATQRAVQ